MKFRQMTMKKWKNEKIDQQMEKCQNAKNEKNDKKLEKSEILRKI